MILAALLFADLPVVALKDVDCNKAVVTAEVTYCAHQDFVRADAELNDQWEKTLDRMKERDKFIDPNRDHRPATSAALVEAQRDWLKFRDAHCLTEQFLTRGGTAEPSMKYACLAKLTRDRIAQLRFLQRWPE